MQTPQTTGRAIAAGAWAAVIAVVLSFSLQKGASDTVQGWGSLYWWLDYGDGMVRRALMGQLFQAVFGDLSPQALRQPVFWVHWASLAYLAVAMVAQSSRVMWRLPARDYLPFAAIAIWLFVSQLWGTLAYNVGYLDSYVLLLALVAAQCLSRGWVAPSALIMAAAPFVHEYFLFLIPFILAVAWRPGSGGGAANATRPREAAPQGPRAVTLVVLALLPVISTAIILMTSDAGAAQAQLAEMPLPQDQKETLLHVQLGQGVDGATGRMIKMLTTNIDYNLANFAFFLLPALVLTGAILWWKAPRRSMAPWLQAAAGLFPASALLVAWDLSRLLVMTSFTAGAIFLVLALRRTEGDER